MRRSYVLRRIGVAAAAIALVAAILAAGYFGGKALFGSGKTSSAPAAAPAPRVVLKRPKPQAATDLGFPAFATNNTTRVGGVDPTTDAAGVALAVYPSTSAATRPPAVSLVSDDEWQDGIAAASLMAQPIGAPVLVSSAQSVPAITTEALRSLAPAGSAATGGNQLFAIGSATAPEGPKTATVRGSDPASVAAGVAALRERLTHTKPEHIVIASSIEPAYAMPAASWAARSGDPVLFAGKGPAPVATLKYLHRNPGVPVYVLGPEAAVSNRAFSLIQKVSPGATRIAGPDPVSNSIDFAKEVDGTFGWNINDPGHGLVIANVARPLDAAAAAPLSGSGSWGPLLVTTSSIVVPPQLRSYLLELKPGYLSDPTRAVFNHVWLIGAADAISVSFQGQVDDLVALAKVRSAAAAQAAKTP